MAVLWAYDSRGRETCLAVWRSTGREEEGVLPSAVSTGTLMVTSQIQATKRTVPTEPRVRLCACARQAPVCDSGVFYVMSAVRLSWPLAQAVFLGSISSLVDW